MLRLVLPEIRFWDDLREEFVTVEKEKELVLEHSLVSVSKWESKWHKPFLSKERKSSEETIDYIRCMTITQNVSDDTYNRITNEHINQVIHYIDDPMTATWFSNDGQGSNREIITSEIIYSWMVDLAVPVSFEKWHLNRLITLIRVINERHKPKKKVNMREMLSERRRINEARKKQLNTKG